MLPTRKRALLRLELPGVSVPVDRHPHWHSLPGYTDNHDLKPIPINFLINAARQAPGLLRAALAGVFLDLCSHGILAVGMKLYERGASAGQVMTFLLASPWNSFSLTLILYDNFYKLKQ